MSPELVVVIAFALLFDFLNGMRDASNIVATMISSRAESMPQLAAGEVLISVGAVGICGSEPSGFLGHNSLRVPPFIMGNECAGQVVQVTEGTFVTGEVAAVGARVTFNPLVVCGTCDRCVAGWSNLCRHRQLVGAHRPGGFAQYVAVPACQCYPLPKHLSLVTGSLAEPLACSIRAVAHSKAKPQDRLLILGAGPIGLCALAAARAQGVEQIIVSAENDPLPHSIFFQAISQPRAIYEK